MMDYEILAQYSIAFSTCKSENEDTDQPIRVCRLIWASAVYMCDKILFLYHSPYTAYCKDILQKIIDPCHAE